MATFKRADRVADRIMIEMADLLRRRINDPRLALVQCTGVKVTDDLRHARIFFVETGADVCSDAVRDGLQAAAGFVRRELGHRLQLRYVPEIQFLYDPSFAYGSKIERLLVEIHKEGDAAEDH